MRRTCLVLALLVLSACTAALEEELVIVEPVTAEPVSNVDDLNAKGADLCESTGDDGIGGTGCPAEP